MLLASRNVCVVGPVPTERFDDQCDSIILVEGAMSSNASDIGRVDIMVGDLDSTGLNMLDFCADTKICFIHVHGDNFNRVVSVVGKPYNIVFTSQAYCIPPVLGVGGYTDGDRAVIIPLLFGAKNVVVRWFDFSRPYYVHKKHYFNYNIKQIKLKLAEKIIHEISKTLGYRLIIDAGGFILQSMK
jgi:uncharacterized Rossmann fold enzyme